jgi:hypothetical protein
LGSARRRIGGYGTRVIGGGSPLGRKSVPPGEDRLPLDALPQPKRDLGYVE